MSTLTVTFVQATFVLATFVHIRNNWPEFDQNLMVEILMGFDTIEINLVEFIIWFEFFSRNNCKQNIALRIYMQKKISSMF